ncbi:MAG TPA: hypothetical protein VFL86_06945 [Burkholderiaceae bacterium]|nr:hypothetical protein [Burkholderiaceae bacterium]
MGSDGLWAEESGREVGRFEFFVVEPRKKPCLEPERADYDTEVIEPLADALVAEHGQDVAEYLTVPLRTSVRVRSFEARQSLRMACSAVAPDGVTTRQSKRHPETPQCSRRTPSQALPSS